MANLLNIVNEDDEVIGQEERAVIHRDGRLHREVHVYFITPDGGLILQHRAKDKDMYPDMLDATVGGHVEIGQSYTEAAIAEASEETGQVITKDDLIDIGKKRQSSVDKVTGKNNNVFKYYFAYVFRGEVGDLQIESGKAIGFEKWPLPRFKDLPDNESKLFVPSTLRFVTEYADRLIDLSR